MWNRKALGQSQQSEAYPAMQKLVAWYGSRDVITASAGWADGEQSLRVFGVLQRAKYGNMVNGEYGDGRKDYHYHRRST